MNLSDAIHAAGLSHHAELIKRLAQPSVRLIASRVADGEGLPLGASRIGGTPDLPDGTAWACASEVDTRDEGWNVEGKPMPSFPLPFLAQVNFAEIAALGLPDSPLPSAGILYAFADAESGHWQIRYSEPSMNLNPVPFPDNMPVIDRYPAYGLVAKTEWHIESVRYTDEEMPTFDAELMLLSRQSIQVERHLFGNIRERDPFSNLRSMVRFSDVSKPETENYHRLLGMEEPIQSAMSPLELSAKLDGKSVAHLHGIPTDDPIVAHAIEEAIVAQWTLLLQIDSIRQEPTMVWGDTGTHYWWIKRADLLRRDFSGVQYDFQCG